MPKFGLAEGEEKAFASICLASICLGWCGGSLCGVRPWSLQTANPEDQEKCVEDVDDTKGINFQMQKANCRKIYFLLVWK